MSQLIHNIFPTYDREHLVFILKLYSNFSQINKEGYFKQRSQQVQRHTVLKQHNMFKEEKVAQYG